MGSAGDSLAEPLRPTSGRARLRIGVGAAVGIGLLALCVVIVLAAVNSVGTARAIPVGTPTTVVTSSDSGAAIPGQDAQAPAQQAILLHVLGAVRDPGLFALRQGDRVVDALAAAGGLTKRADEEAVNLARPVTDGEQLYVPELGESPRVALPADSSESSSGDSATPDAPVSLTTATAEQLEQLPRIGPAMAERIISWRNANGAFTAVEQLLEVPGIGEKTFEGLRDFVLP